MSSKTKSKNTVQPKLRFPEFRDAGDWEEKPLSDFCSKITQGGTPDTSKPDFWNGEIEWLTPAEMGKRESRFIHSTVRKITESGLKKCSSDLLPINSVIVSTRAPIGHLAINTSEMAINQGCKGLIPKKTTSYNFLYYFLLHFKPSLADLGAGNTFKELSATALKNFPSCFPILPEQQKIAACLSSLDDLIAAEDQKLGALKRHKKGLMQELFPAEGETLPNRRFPEFLDAGEWEVKTLDKLAANVVASGDLDSNYFSPFQTDKHKYPVYSNALEKEGLYGYYSIGKYPSDSITITARGNLGTAFLRKAIFMGIGRLIVVSKLKDSIPYFLKECWNYAAFIPQEVTSIPQLTAVAAKATLLPIPTEEEQQKIAECLSSLDELITAHSQKLDALRAHKKGLMQQLFPTANEG